MVRLVFRPYTQVWRSICTLESLRASIRVSPDFALLRHSSPSFGSQRIRSDSDRWQVPTGRWCTRHNGRDPISDNALAVLYFHCALEFFTQILAYTLDSLVRVSRRAEASHLIRIANNASGLAPRKSGKWAAQLCSTTHRLQLERLPCSMLSIIILSRNHSQTMAHWHRRSSYLDHSLLLRSATDSDQCSETTPEPLDCKHAGIDARLAYHQAIRNA